MAKRQCKAKAIKLIQNWNVTASQDTVKQLAITSVAITSLSQCHGIN